MSSESSRQSNIRRFFLNLVAAHPALPDVVTRRRAELAAVLSLAMVVLTLFTAALLFYDRRYVLPMVYGFLALAGAAVVAYLLSRSRLPLLGAILLTASPTVLGFYLAASRSPVYTALFFTVPLTMLLASILLPFYAAAGITAFDILATALSSLVLPDFPRLSAYLLAVQFATLGCAILIVMATRSALERQRLKEIEEANERLLGLQQTLEQRVEDRTRQVRTATEMTQKISTALTRKELLERVIHLLADHFRFYETDIYLIDETGGNAYLRAAHGPASEALLAQPPRIAIGSETLAGWALKNRQTRLVTDLAADPLYRRSELLPETQAQACIPILLSERTHGVIDIHAASADALDQDTLTTLQGIASQLAAALENIQLIEAAQVDLQGVNDIFQSSFQIAQAQTESGAIEAAARILRQTPYASVLLRSEQDGLRVATINNTHEEAPGAIPDWIGIRPSDLAERLSTGMLVGDVRTLADLPSEVVNILQQLRLAYAAIIPIFRSEGLMTVLIMGSTEESPLLPAAVRPYASIAELLTAAIERISGQKATEHRLSELESISVASQAIAGASNLNQLYKAIHEQVRLMLGDTTFLVAIYDKNTDSIEMPYVFNLTPGGGETGAIESFPLGEGLTSILIRTKQPLMVVEDTEKRLAALGAKHTARPAKSWLGVPLLVAGEAIGAIVAEDIEEENAFDDGDLRFVSTLASQVAGAIYNVRLLEETRKRAIQLQTAAEIARDISGSLDVNELLVRAVSMIRERFDFYHAAVFLIEASGEHAVIREATGEAGVQMKRAGHKLGVGSKSIVGFVSGSGEILIVNDTTRDATYYANPLLPETRSELAIPLKVGTRILGVLDVQSATAYAFGQEDINVLRILADQLAVAVLNSELFAETQEHLSQHRLLHHVTSAAASGTTLDEALNSAAQGLQVTLGGDRVAIMLVNREKKALEVKAVAGYASDSKNVEVQIGTGVTGWVAAHLQPLRLDDVTKDSRYVPFGADCRSELAIPLLYRGELLGVLNVESDQTGAYSENDEEMLGTLGGSLAAIIANARLIEQIRRQVDRERLLYEVTSKIRRSTDMNTIMETTARELAKALGARRARVSVGTGQAEKSPEKRSG